MIKKLSKKKGVSPVIATVLLIAMVIVIALIIFLWFRSMIQEKITKFSDTNIQTVCGDVKFDASYDYGSLFISNTGNVPIYSFKIKMIEAGSHETKDIKDFSSASWPSVGLNQGGTFSGELGLDSSVDEIEVIPVLIGMSDKGKKSYTCEERYGYNIIISG